MKVIRVLGLLLLGLICSFLLVLAPDLGSGLKASGTNVAWLNICALTGIGLAASVLFVEVFPKGHVSGLHFPQSLSLALMAASLVVGLISSVSVLTTDYSGNSAAGQILARSSILLSFVMATVATHLSVALFRYGEKLPVQDGVAA
jgi:hypothetical protein